MKKRHARRALPVSMGALICVGLLQGLLPGLVSAQSSDGAHPPTITSFEITHISTDNEGVKKSWLEISWHTEDADRVRLYKDGRELRGRSRLADGTVGWPVSMDRGFKVQHKSSALFKLVAENEQGEVSRTVAVEAQDAVKPPIADGPEILEFRLEPQSIAPGDAVRFYWQTRGAYRVQLHDDQGEIESRIVLPKGDFGWPLSMDGSVSESPSESTTYKLVAIGKAGSVSESFQVEVAGGECHVQVTISGKYGKYTDGIGVYRAGPRGPGEFLFDKAVSTVRDRRTSRDPSSPQELQRASFTAPPGEYFLIPRGGGQDNVGPFSVLYRPGRSRITCISGSSERFSFTSDQAEY